MIGVIGHFPSFILQEIISDSSILDERKLNFSYTSVTCVVTMGQFVTKSSSISVNVFGKI